MAIDNNTILAAAYLQGTNDYQQRVPRVTQAGVSRVAETLFQPGNADLLNQFSNFLINRIGTHYIRQKAFKNPLGFLKNDTIAFGNTIEETALQWARGHSFNSDDMATETILKTHYPEGLSAYHGQNREDVYEVSSNPMALKRAFVGDTGLNDYLGAILETVINADNWDEFNIMKNLFAEYDRYSGMYKHRVIPAEDETTAKAMLRTLREFADTLKYPSTIYNAQNVDNIPTFASDSDELVLFTNPRTKSALDVLGLAPLFHNEYGEIPYRVITLDTMPLPEVDAILTVRDSFIVADTVYEMRSWEDIHSLSTQHVLHHWGVYSLSPFTPMIAFSTNDQTTVPIIEMTVSGIEFNAPEEIYANEKRSMPALTINLLGTINGREDVCLGNIGIKPDTATFTVDSVKDSEGNEMAWTEQNIQLFDNGEIYVQARGNSKLLKAIKNGGVTVTITALATYINPGGQTTEYTQTKEITVLCAPQD